MLPCTLTKCTCLVATAELKKLKHKQARLKSSGTADRVLPDQKTPLLSSRLGLFSSCLPSAVCALTLLLGVYPQLERDRPCQKGVQPQAELLMEIPVLWA